MLETVYRLWDRRRRPVRDRHFVVLPALRLAYARVPKAANSSVKQVLSAHVDAAGVELPPNTDWYWADEGVRGGELVTAAELTARYPDAFVFTFVRDPFSRVVSCYTNKVLNRRTITKRFRRFGCRRGMSFDEFVRVVARVGDRRADNHFRSQQDMLSHRGRLLPHFVGRVDRIHDDWERLRERVQEHAGVDLGKLPWRNRTKRNRLGVRECFSDPERVALVRRRYRLDFRAFYPDWPDPA